jgi:predicted phosphate transport protein (TIGR00153 family)
MRTFHKLFGTSPFTLLVEHTRRVHRAVELIRPLFDAFLDQDWERCETLYNKISKREHKADLEKNKIRDQLPKSIFLPVNRGDVLKYLKEQDAIADSCEDVAVLVTLRRTPCPEELKPLVLDFVDQVIRTSEVLVEAGSALTELVESRFSGPEVDRVLALVADVNEQEWEADKRQRILSRAIMEREAELDAVSIVFWMRIIAKLGAIANHAENTGDMLRLMLAHG